MEKVEDLCALFEVDHKDLSRLQGEVAEEMRPAFVEAENIELEARQPAKSTKKAPIQTKSRKLFKQKPTQIVKVLKSVKDILWLSYYQCNYVLETS